MLSNEKEIPEDRVLWQSCRSRSTGRTAVTAGNANRDRGFGIGPRAAVTLNFPGAQLANESVSGAYVYSTPGPDGLRLFDANIPTWVFAVMFAEDRNNAGRRVCRACMQVT